MPPIRHLTGQRFGKLTVLRRASSGTWLCRCDCGREKEVVTNSLTRGLTRSCGCARVSPFAKYPGRWRRKARDLTGNAFGRLTVIGPAEARNGKLAWNCRCVCGAETIVLGSNLVRGNTLSCGCHRKENAKVILSAGNTPAYERYCRRCGTKFMATARQCFCSPACAKHHEPLQVHCGVCGKLCPAKDGRRYHEGECRATAKQQLAAARIEQDRFRRMAELGAELERRLDQSTEKPNEGRPDQLPTK